MNIEWKEFITFIILFKEIFRIMCLVNIEVLFLLFLYFVRIRYFLIEGVEVIVSLMYDVKFVIRVFILFELILRIYYILIRMSKYVLGKYGFYL